MWRWEWYSIYVPSELNKPGFFGSYSRKLKFNGGKVICPIYVHTVKELHQTAHPSVFNVRIQSYLRTMPLTVGGHVSLRTQLDWAYASMSVAICSYVAGAFHSLSETAHVNMYVLYSFSCGKHISKRPLQCVAGQNHHIVYPHLVCTKTPNTRAFTHACGLVTELERSPVRRKICSQLPNKAGEQPRLSLLILLASLWQGCICWYMFSCVLCCMWRDAVVGWQGC